jgi:Holliday junction resolvase-like predicted endonuclease
VKHIKKHSTNRKGDLAEYYAVTWLWDNGYEVFKNCGCDGFVDLVVRDPQGNIKLIDVKSARKDHRKEKYWTSRTTSVNICTNKSKRTISFIYT